MKRRFKVTKPELISQFVAMKRTTDENGTLIFSNKEVLMIARATGLKSKKRRHIHKRFRLVMQEAVLALLDSYKGVDTTL